MKVLFLGDVVGRPGREAIAAHLPALVEDAKIDFVIANGENASGGFGLSQKDAKELYTAGVNVITLGNHTWSNGDILDIFDTDRKVIRPANFPPGTPGVGFRVYTAPNGKRVGVVNVMARTFMEGGLDCPFQFTRNFLKEHRMGDDYDALVVDVHGETTSEKVCLGHIWDGRASLVVGTHTHVPTADTRIQPKGTGYQSDAGMCGFYDSSIGHSFEAALPRFESKGRVRRQIASGEGTMCGVLVHLKDDGLCESIQPIRRGGILSHA